MKYINYETNEEITLEQTQIASVVKRENDTIYFVNVPTSNELRIAELKQKLAETDYICLKFVDGEITQAEYAETWQKRKQWREEINKLEKEI